MRVAQRTVGFGMWDWNPATDEVRWSPELESLYGLRPGNFPGRYQDFTRFIVPGDRKRYQRELRRIMAEGESPFEVEFRICRADGEVRWISSRGVSVRGVDGEVARMIGVNFDVTDRKRAEESLKEKDEYLRVALKRSEFQIFHQDAQLRYTWVANPMLGAAREDVIGRTDQEVIGGESGRAITTIKRRALKTGRGEHHELWVSRDGRTGCFDLFVEPQRDAEGRVTGIVCAATDISARKRALQDLEEAHRSTQELAAHLTGSVEEERSALARDVHDQVGAVLTGLRLRLAALARSVPDAAIHLRSELLDAEAMTEAAMIATREICSRLRPPALEDLGLTETCRWYAKDWATSTGLKISGRFPKLREEPDESLAIDLFRVLQELLTNVAKHARAARVTVRLGEIRGALRLVVTDDGCGFAPDAAKHGFGLAGIRERARHHNGRVEIDSGPRGSTVTVTLPLRGKA
jgi:PAS domain S-box-containing protein